MASDLGIIDVFSFYSPIIVTTSILVFSIFSGMIQKGLWFIFMTLLATMFRIAIYWGTGAESNARHAVEKCNTGVFLPYDNATYSIFLLAFSLFYFLTPMLLSQNMNWWIFAFFVIYLCFDIFVKFSCGCLGVMTAVFGDIVSGIGISSLLTAGIYGTSMRDLLFVNTSGSKNTTCSMASKTKFKCSVYKNGELIGTQ